MEKIHKLTFEKIDLEEKNENLRSQLSALSKFAKKLVSEHQVALKEIEDRKAWKKRYNQRQKYNRKNPNDKFTY